MGLPGSRNSRCKDLEAGKHAALPGNLSLAWLAVRREGHSEAEGGLF